jgi:hypothetical protein
MKSSLEFVILFYFRSRFRPVKVIATVLHRKGHLAPGKIRQQLCQSLPANAALPCLITDDQRRIIPA